MPQRSSTSVDSPATHTRHQGLWVFVAALLVRLVYFAWSQSSPFLYQLSTDEAFYVDYARRILAGQVFEYANFMDPLPAYLLAIPLFFTDNLYLARLGFVVLDSVNAWLVYRICCSLLNNHKPALLAASLYIVYSLTVICSVFITKSTLVIFFLLAITQCLLSGMQIRQRHYFVLAGILLALLFFTGASYLLLVPCYFFLLLWFAHGWRFAVYLLEGVAVVVGVHSVYFQWQGENKTLMPTNGGEIFYISNHAANIQGTHLVPAFVQESTPVGIYQAFKKQAQQLDATLTEDHQISAFWYQQTIAENLAHPALALQREWNKARFMLANSEISQNYYLPYIRSKTLHNLPLLTFGIVLAFGAGGFVLLNLPARFRWLLALPVLLVLVNGMVFFVSARMRLPMVPFLMIACAGWFNAMQVPRKHLLSALALTAMLLAGSYCAVPEAGNTASPQDDYNLALVMLKANMPDEAAALIDSVLQRETTAKYLFLKAVIESARGHCQTALSLYDKVEQMQPGYPDLVANRQWCIDFMQRKPASR